MLELSVSEEFPSNGVYSTISGFPHAQGCFGDICQEALESHRPSQSHGLKMLGFLFLGCFFVCWFGLGFLFYVYKALIIMNIENMMKSNGNVFAQLAAEKCFLLRSYWVAEFGHKNASNLQRLEHHHEKR